MNTRPAADEGGFALYLARQYAADSGFRPGFAPEAERLAGAADIVLTGMDGLAFTTICIVDRERDPTREFGLTRAETQAIGEACAHYSEAIGGARMPAVIKIIEVGRTPPDAAQIERLGAFRRDHFFTRCALSAWVVDTTAGTVWTTSSFGGRLGGRPFIERLLREPRVPHDQIRPRAAALQAQTAPVATQWLLALLALVFLAEQAFPVTPVRGFLTPSTDTLLALGGLDRGLVADGDWWRLLSAALLHGSPMHILFNGIALWMAGHFLESLVGRAWFLALFVIGALGGAAMSLAVNPPNVVSVGASGAIMGLLGAALVASYRLPKGPRRSGIQLSIVQMLVPSLLPIFFAGATDGLRIDYGAHLGGVLAGAGAGLAMTAFWPHSEPLPRLRGLAAAITLAAVAVVATAGIELARRHQGYVAAQLLIPPDEMPGTRHDERRRVGQLLARYPHDPRAHAMMAARLREDAHDFAGAERELRAALAEKRTLELFEPALTHYLQASLALVLADQHRLDEARPYAALACAAGAAKSSNAVLELRQRGLCEPGDGPPAR